MKKRMKVLLVLGALILLVGVGATFAYLSDHGGTKVNAFTFGEVTIDIEEIFHPPTTLRVGDNTYEKRVVFKNNGKNEAYARGLLAFSSTDVADVSKISSDGGTTWYTLTEFKTHLPSGWAYIESGELGGYYYYTKALKPGESTTPLITHVKTTFQQKTADTNRTINYTPRDYDVYVYAEGLQQIKMNGSELHSSYQTAWTEFLRLK